MFAFLVTPHEARRAVPTATRRIPEQESSQVRRV